MNERKYLQELILPSLCLYNDWWIIKRKQDMKWELKFAKLNLSANTPNADIVKAKGNGCKRYTHAVKETKYSDGHWV